MPPPLAETVHETAPVGFSFSGSVTGATRLFAAVAGRKLAAKRMAARETRVIERAIWSDEARVEWLGIVFTISRTEVRIACAAAVTTLTNNP